VLTSFFRGKWKSALMLLIPVAGFLNLVHIPEGNHFSIPFLDYTIVFCRMDRLSFVFGTIFHLISFIAVLYSLHVKDGIQHAAGLVYAGSALGVVYAGDFFSFFVFWEMLTISSIFLIWARSTKAALDAGYRYLLVHAAGGLCLLAGIVIQVNQTGSIAFEFLGLNGPGTWLIFLGSSAAEQGPPP